MKNKEPLFKDDPDALMSSKDAAAFIGRSTKYLAKLRVTGGGPEFVRLSHKQCGYTKASLVAWIKRRTFKSTSQERAVLRPLLLVRS